MLASSMGEAPKTVPPLKSLGLTIWKTMAFWEADLSDLECMIYAYHMPKC